MYMDTNVPFRDTHSVAESSTHCGLRKHPSKLRKHHHQLDSTCAANAYSTTKRRNVLQVAQTTADMFPGDTKKVINLSLPWFVSFEVTEVGSSSVVFENWLKLKGFFFGLFNIVITSSKHHCTRPLLT